MKIFKPTYERESVHHIEENFFKEEGITCVLLDIDNTLVADNQPCADDGARSFISRLQGENIKICLVSNNKKERVASFNGEFNLRAVHRACKPLCYKINRIIRELGVDKKEVLFVGDQLLTDIPAGNRSKIRTMLVKPINVSKENNFFKFKRFIEKKVLDRNFR